MTVDEVADELGISRQRVYEYCRAGRLGQRWGKRWLITRQDYEKFLETYPGKPGRPPKEDQTED